MSSIPVSSSLSRLFLGAPLLAALCLPVGCSHGHRPAQEPSAATGQASARADMSTTRAALTATADGDAATSDQGTTLATSTRPASQRDSLLSSPPIVSGKVDRGDLSELLTHPPLPATIDQSDIDQMFRGSSDALQRCFYDRSAPSGSEVIVGFVIGNNGRVASAWPVSSQVNDVQVSQCVIRTVNSFQFYPTSGGSTRATSIVHYEL